jgi:hypothetical protein
MFNNIALDACIGLIFIYLLYSLLAMVLLEIYTQIFSSRAKELQKAIRRMLEDDKPKPKNDPRSFTNAFYDFPLIKYLGKGGWHKLPSYLTAQNFSQAVTQLLRTDNFDQTKPAMELIRNTLFPSRDPQGAQVAALGFDISPETLRYLRMLWTDSNNDFDKFKAKLESWFSDTMDRTSGWYKRKTNRRLLVIGIFLAMSLNIDTIAIVSVLAKDQKARDQIVNMALEKYKVDGAKGTGSADDLKEIQKNVGRDASAASMILGLGWGGKTEDKELEKKLNFQIDSAGKELIRFINPESYSKLPDSAKRKYDSELGQQITKKCTALDSLKTALTDYKSHVSPVTQYQANAWIMILGFVITALALSLGAPFWFDMLSKLVQLRGTGPKAIDNKSADPSGKSSPKSNSTDPINRKG